MKSYLKHNRYLFLCTIIILLAQLVSTLLYGDNEITVLIQTSLAVYKVSSWLFFAVFFAYSLIIGLIYWKAEQHQSINFQLKRLHINLTLITVFLGLLANNLNFLQKQLLLIKYSSFPFIKFNSTEISILAILFIIIQFIFIVYFFRIFYSKQKKSKS